MSKLADNEAVAMAAKQLLRQGGRLGRGRHNGGLRSQARATGRSVQGSSSEGSGGVLRVDP